MKRKLAMTLAIIILFIPLCLLADFYIISPLFNIYHNSFVLVEYLVISMSGIFLFIFLLAIMIIQHHLFKKDRYHSKFYIDIQEALNRITRGDLGVVIDIDLNHDKHFIELAEKVNVMAKELRGMEAMRENFVSNVSHEIRSPLTSIQGFTALLKDGKLSEKDRLHYIDIIQAESLRLYKLSDNLLKLSTLDSEYAPFKPKAYLLNKQLKDVILLLEPQWAVKNIKIVVEDEDVNITADKELLNEVWINILNNSIKFTQTYGEIYISISKSDKGAKVIIKDNGIGMTTDTITHIFERFYMADKARSRKNGGSGLGLSIVKKIVEIHKGFIDVKSSLGIGTTFSIIIPYK
ncbi:MULTISPECIES: cell wall metabolism sensor histidine kinase WalK [Clostridium]|uniref:histidine kinase n=1 Tax=Clostridium ragsdalei P11 TaxID=1353534 RepID=A0A1A6AMZ6_9CLOT|nr:MULTISPECIES: HAMP domain-containing sensor histidine kinase [Clostridium]OBR91393.1 alkaline phosphatase synthesis sensor protein PhoR [Clostridium ragsdalei P11]QXE17773.1 sensor histidine kinase [Clostridium sp. 001]